MYLKAGKNVWIQFIHYIMKQEQETFVEIREDAEYIGGELSKDDSGESSEDDPTIVLHANCMVFGDQ